MPAKLSTILARISSVPNDTNRKLIEEFRDYLRETDAFERHLGNEILVVIYYANYLGPRVSFLDISSKSEVISFLDSKKKHKEIDPDERWITTWNDYLATIKHFLRWLHNQRAQDDTITEWKTPSFLAIKKKTKRLSPYSETEIWERNELLLIVKYEPHPRNKAALTLLWDIDACHRRESNISE